MHTLLNRIGGMINRIQKEDSDFISSFGREYEPRRKFYAVCINCSDERILVTVGLTAKFKCPRCTSDQWMPATTYGIYVAD